MQVFRARRAADSDYDGTLEGVEAELLAEDFASNPNEPVGQVYCLPYNEKERRRRTSGEWHKKSESMGDWNMRVHAMRTTQGDPIGTYLESILDSVAQLRDEALLGERVAKHPLANYGLHPSDWGYKLNDLAESCRPAWEDGPAAPGREPPQAAAGRGCFATGERVRVTGLKSSPEHNDKRGAVLSFCVDKGRYRVRLDGRDKALGIKQGNLKKEGCDCNRWQTIDYNCVVCNPPTVVPTEDVDDLILGVRAAVRGVDFSRTLQPVGAGLLTVSEQSDYDFYTRTRGVPPRLRDGVGAAPPDHDWEHWCPFAPP